MKNKQLMTERKQFMKIAGLLVEAKNSAYSGTDSIPDLEFEFNGKEYMASVTVNFNFDWDSEDGIYNYDHTVEVDSLAVSDGNEYIPTKDSSEIAAVQNLLNTDPELSRQLEKYVDTSSAEPDVDDSYDETFDDLEEDSDYSMGTPSGDTDAMGDLAEYGPPHPYITSLDDAIEIVEDSHDFVANYADEDSEGRNEARTLQLKLIDLKQFLEGMRKKY